MTLEGIVHEGNLALHDELGYYPQHTNIRSYDQNQWEEFSSVNSFSDEHTGCYTEQDNTAHIPSFKDYLAPNIFHEYHGHGTHHEYGEPNSSLTNNDLLDKEGFATWIEGKISKKTGRKQDFKEKLHQTEPIYKHLYHKFQRIEKQGTKFSILGNLGLPKFYDEEDVKDLLQKLHKEPEKIELAMLYGSKKPRSDVDIFIVSDQNNTYRNDWLNIDEVSNETFSEGVQHLEITITEPILTGDLIKGNEQKLKEVQKTIKQSHNR